METTVFERIAKDIDFAFLQYAEILRAAFFASPPLIDNFSRTVRFFSVNAEGAMKIVFAGRAMHKCYPIKESDSKLFYSINKTLIYY